LVLPIRVAPISNLFEGIYGYAMKLRGYSLHALFCGQAFKKWENRNSNDSVLNCSLCYHEQKRFADSFSIKGHWIDSLISDDLGKKIRNLVNNENDCFQLRYDEVFFGHHIKSAVLRYFLVSDVDLKKDAGLVREFAYTTIASYEVTKKIIDELNPKYALISHGVYSTWGGAMEACKKLNVPVVVWGRGYIGGNILASWNNSYLFEKIYEPVDVWENCAFSKEMQKKTEHYYMEKRNPTSCVDMVNYYNRTNESKNEVKNIVEYLNIKPDRVVFGMFPNIPWDGTTFSASKAFPSLQFFVAKTIDWFKRNPQCDLIIRAHPAETKTKAKETVKDIIKTVISDLPNNIYFLESDHIITSYKVQQIVDCSLIFAGTLALEFAFFGGCVIQTGLSNCSNKGFLFEPKTVKDYENLLKNVANGKLKVTENMKNRAQHYAYHWLFKAHIPDNIYNRKNLLFASYNINNSMDLSPGNYKVVDWFIDRCEDKKPFIWNGF
jgi:hypothetical protein